MENSTTKYIPCDDKNLESYLVKFNACASCDESGAEIASALN
jgi:hypothetical protein